ncbi:MAG: hypothetical protein FWC41_12515, partial [Firmicutes bacterium]|nr:hypothetical protein [Bacillota bacterium]
MNLKESFRYQKHLDNLMFMAQQSITNKMHALKITKNHLRSKANSEATDEVEIVDAGDFHANDDVLKFMKYLITQKEALSTAISKAKASLAIDIDAATETNKYRQNLKSSIASM